MSTMTHMQVDTMIGDLISTAILCKMESSELYRQFGELPVFSKYNGKGKHKHPHWLRMYAKGYFAANRNMIYRDYLEFCYVDSEGVFYSTHPDSQHRKTEEWYKAGKGSNLGKLPSGHYWKGTKKPWFVGGENN